MRNLLLAVLLLAGCGKPTAYNGPKPFLTPPTDGQPYAHWACPKGYEVAYDGYRQGSAVYCANKDTVNEEMDEYERSMKPQGKP